MAPQRRSPFAFLVAFAFLATMAAELAFAFLATAAFAYIAQGRASLAHCQSAQPADAGGDICGHQDRERPGARAPEAAHDAASPEVGRQAAIAAAAEAASPEVGAAAAEADIGQECANDDAEGCPHYGKSLSKSEPQHQGLAGHGVPELPTARSAVEAGLHSEGSRAAGLAGPDEGMGIDGSAMGLQGLAEHAVRALRVGGAARNDLARVVGATCAASLKI